MKTIFALILMFVLTNSHAQKKELRLNLEKGHTYNHKSKTNTTVSQDVNGKITNIVMEISGSTSFLVNSVTNNGYDMMVKIDSMGMSMQMPNGVLEFNSEKTDTTNILSMLLSKMTNIPFEVKMTRSGKVTEVNNYDKVWELAISQFPQIPQEQVEQIKNQIMKAFGEKALKGNIEMTSAIFPDKPVATGDSWTITTNLETVMSTKMITTYTYKEKTKEYILINGVSKIDTKDKDAYVEINGMSFRYDLTGTMNSAIKIDLQSGWILNSENSQEITGDMYINPNAQIPNGMKVPMSVISQTLIKNN